MALVEYYPSVDRPVAPECSVCIAHYRGPILLSECLDSLLAQDCDFSYEIVVHDDNSNDGSIELLRQKYPQVEVLASAENVGFCVANNRMVEHARGTYVLLLNNDAALYPDALSTLLKASRQIPSGILSLPQFDWESDTLVDRGCRLDPFYNPVPNLDSTRSQVAMVIGACLWIERSLWRQLGGFPTWLESVGEDLYLCCAARLSGAPVQALARSGYRHRQGHSFGGNKPSKGRLISSFRRRRLSERNKTFALFVMTPTRLVWPLLLVHLLLLTIEGVVFGIARRDARIWREIYGPVFVSLYSERDNLRLQRRTVQRTRSVTLVDYLRTFIATPRKLTMLWSYGWPKLESRQ